MTPNNPLYAAVLQLSRADIKTLQITDTYSLHRVVYSLFADKRNEAEKKASVPSGILWADKGGDHQSRFILLLSDREPNISPPHGVVQIETINPQFLQHERYAFEVVINPGRRDNKSRKILPVRGREAIAEWFIERSTESWGFSVSTETLQVEKTSVQQFKKGEKTITHNSATIKGELVVTDRERFITSFHQGIGRGRAFGFGLLQIVPLKPGSTP